MANNILTIDCGTQSLRALIFNADGILLAFHQIHFNPYYSEKPGWAEQNPEIYWEALKKAC